MDVVFLIDALYKEGEQPDPYYIGDVDGDCDVNILDVVYIINYKYKEGPAPLVGCE